MNPFRYFYDWATEPRRADDWRTLPLVLPILAFAVPLALAVAIGPLMLGPGSDSLMRILGWAMWFWAICTAGWFIYIFWRLTLNVIAAAAFLKEEMWPDWVSGWRGAWAVIRKAICRW